jgi:small conductance mechanosensitive channel
MLIILSNLKVNDTIEAQGVIGTVSEIQIFVTKLIANNQTIFVPNGACLMDIIITLCKKLEELI